MGKERRHRLRAGHQHGSLPSRGVRRHPSPLTTLTDRKKHTTNRWPYFLPDGKHVLYLAANHANPKSEENGIYVVSLDGGASRRLMSSYGSAQYASGVLLSVRDTSLMALLSIPGESPSSARRCASPTM